MLLDCVCVFFSLMSPLHCASLLFCCLVFFCFAILVALLLLLRVIVVVEEGGRWGGVGSSSNSKLFSGSSFRLATNKLRLAFCAANCGAAAAVCAALSAQRRRLLLTPTQTHAHAEFEGSDGDVDAAVNCKHTHKRTHAKSSLETNFQVQSSRLNCVKKTAQRAQKKNKSTTTTTAGANRTKRNIRRCCAAAAAVDVTLRGSPLLLLLPRSLPRTQAQRLTHTHARTQRHRHS